MFRHDTRRLPWGDSEYLLKLYSLRLFLAVQVVSVAVWLVVAGLLYFTLADYDRSFYRFATSTLLQADLLLLIAAALASLVLDVVDMRAALNGISGEVLAGRWDLVRLTALHEQGIVRAKHNVAQLQAWRPTVIMAAIRFAGVWIYLISYFLLPGVLLGDSALLTSRFNVMFQAPLEGVLVGLISLCAAAIYIFEPFWRMKAMTALGLTISSYVLDGPLAMLSALGAIFAVWLGQALVLLSLIFGFGVFAPLFFFTSTATFLYVYVLAISLINGLVIYGFYVLVQEWGLRRAVWRITRDK